MDRKIAKKKWYQRKQTWILGGVGILLIFAYGFILSDNQRKLVVDVERTTISEVTRGEFIEFIPATGNVEPVITVYLDAVEGGRVEEIFVEDGIMIEEGQPIMRMGNTDLILDVMYREAQLFEQSNNLRNTRLAMEQNRLALKGDLLELDRAIATEQRNYNSAKVLYEKGLLSDNEFENARDQYNYFLKLRELTLDNAKQDSIFRAVQIAQLEQSVERMQQNLVLLRSNQEKLTVRAPISGQLSALNAEIGQTKVPGERLGQIDVLDEYKVRASIDEHYIARVSEGKKAEFNFAGNTWRLELTKIYPQVSDGRFLVDLLFDGDVPNGIRRGQTIRLRLELSDAREALLLPMGGFFNSTGGHWVYVVDKSGNYAEKRDISLGRQNTQMYEVTSGLSEGEHVVTSSYDTYNDVDRLVFRN